MSTLRDRLERGFGMRAQRMIEGSLFAATFVSGDPRPAYLAFAMIALQVFFPFAAPIAVLWSTIDRRVPPDRLGNLYYDKNGNRGAALLSSLALTVAFVLIHWSSVPNLGRFLIAVPAASCILCATVGFCAGCGTYVAGRELLVRAGLVRRIEGACDVDIDG
jgi:hypothetical protein